MLLPDRSCGTIVFHINSMSEVVVNEVGLKIEGPPLRVPRKLRVWLLLCRRAT